MTDDDAHRQFDEFNAEDNAAVAVGSMHLDLQAFVRQYTCVSAAFVRSTALGACSGVNAQGAGCVRSSALGACGTVNALGAGMLRSDAPGASTMLDAQSAGTVRSCHRLCHGEVGLSNVSYHR